jgi:hypothetical protein
MTFPRKLPHKICEISFFLISDFKTILLLTETKVESEDVSKQKWNLC